MNIRRDRTEPVWIYSAPVSEREGLLKEACRRVWNWEKLPPIYKNEYGKPMFDEEHYFNFSHSGAYRLCALAETPVGVDLEKIRGELMVQSFMRADEMPVVTNELAYQCWTVKESFVKCVGTGIGLDVERTMKDIRIIWARQELESWRYGRGYRFMTAAAAGFACSVCLRTQRPVEVKEIRLYGF